MRPMGHPMGNGGPLDRQLRIITVDPGKMTGWASWVPSEDVFEAGEMEWMEWLSWYHGFIATVGQLEDIVTVVESFTITMETLKKTRQHWSLEMIGTMRYLTKIYLDKDIVEQSVGDAKSFATREKLEKMAWWVKGSDHAQDAARHMLTYAVGNDLVDLSRLL